jgi:hypothetical protein
MFLWQYVDLDPDEVDRVKDTFKRNLPLNLHFFQHLEIGVDHFMGMAVSRCALIQVMPMYQGKIHTDVRTGYGGVLAINIPLMNCENSLTELWTSSLENKQVLTENDLPYNIFEKEHCTKIDQFILDRPVIFKTDVPHSVKNNSMMVRRAISLRFKDDPWHLIDNDRK